MTVVNVYQPNAKAAGYLKQLLMDLKGDINFNEIIMRDFNTSLPPRFTRQKLNKATMKLVHTMNQMDLVNNYRYRIHILFVSSWDLL